MNTPAPGKYIRMDGEEFEVIGVAKNVTTGTKTVVYTDVRGEMFTCPLSRWQGYSPLSGISAADYIPAPEPPPPDVTYAPMWDAPAAEFAPFVPEKSKEAVLKEYFGYDTFRDGQDTLIDSILSGRDTVGIMPTGAGKSLCYQIPALMLPGVTLVISPLISLMKDQVAALKQAGVAAAYINSSLTQRQLDLALENAAQGKYRIIYVTPERLETPRFLNLSQRMQISLIAVDEAHCISQWGQDFRPSYLAIPDYIDRLPVRPKVCAFTATATKRVRSDISRIMRLREPFMCVTGFDRPNLYYRVIQPSSKKAELLALMNDYRGRSGIIYCATRKDVEALHDILNLEGYPVTRYHAGLSDAERLRNQEAFQRDEKPIMVATNAFGMGIDKSDVRFVVHYSMPGDLESYYQEAGRAGRDGDSAECTLLYGKQDIFTQRYFIERMGEESELSPDELVAVQRTARMRLQLMIEYCETTACLRAYILNYFGEDSPGRCGACGSCAGEAREGISGDISDVVSPVRPRRSRRDSRPADEPADEALLEKLKELRKSLAQSMSVPAYAIFTDRTLRDMSVKKPRTLDDFMKVSGVGLSKQRSYGREFLRAIEAYESGE